MGKNRVQEMDTNMVHRLGKEQDMVRKMVLGTVTESYTEPGKVTDMVPGKVHKLDMVPGLMTASEPAPAPAPNRCTPPTADQKVMCYLTNSWMNYPCCLTEIYCNQLSWYCNLTNWYHTQTY